MNRKKIFGVVLFLLISFGVYTFANTDDDQKLSEKKEDKTQKVDNKNTSDDQAALDITNNLDNNIVNPVVNFVVNANPVVIPQPVEITLDKEVFLAQLDNYYNSEDYSSTNWNNLSRIINEAKEKILESNNIEEINNLINEAILAANKIETILDETKLIAINNLNYYRQEEVENYSEANIKKVNKIKEEGVELLLNASNILELTNRLNQAKNLIDELDTTVPIVKILDGSKIVNDNEYVDSRNAIRIQPIDENIGQIFINGKEYNQYYGLPSYKIDWVLNQDKTTEKYIIEAIDKSGNKSEVRTIYVDKKIPNINVKDESIGNKELNIYSNVSFKLYDNTKIDYVTINGVKKDLTNNQWSDLNSITKGKFGAIEGVNVLKVYDIYGNENTFTFEIDTIKPIVKILDGSKIVNDNEYVDLNNNIRIQPSDKNIGQILINGKEYTQYYGSGSYIINWAIKNGNTEKFVVEAIDKAGNKSVLTTIYVDKTAPKLELSGYDFTIVEGQTFTNPEITLVNDNRANLNVENVTVTGNVDVNNAGIYYLTYTVSDGIFSTSKTVEVEVKSLITQLLVYNPGESTKYNGFNILFNRDFLITNPKQFKINYEYSIEGANYVRANITKYPGVVASDLFYNQEEYNLFKDGFSFLKTTNFDGMLQSQFGKILLGGTGLIKENDVVSMQEHEVQNRLRTAYNAITKGKETKIRTILTLTLENGTEKVYTLDPVSYN